MRINLIGGSSGFVGTLSIAATTFLLVVGVGATSSYLGRLPERASSAGADVSTQLGSGAELLARLDAYTRSVEGEEPAPTAMDGKSLPDVDTMIGQLADRLKTSPEDIDGWRMLGWSYFNMSRYAEAAAAYATAVRLDPSSDEIKRLYAEAKAKASEIGNLETAATVETQAAGETGDVGNTETVANSDVPPPSEHDGEVVSMVDGLANRLERSPRDIEGWTLLMRSRVVLGEKDVAATALRKALEVFKDDSAASDKIKASAVELGLKIE